MTLRKDVHRTSVALAPLVCVVAIGAMLTVPSVAIACPCAAASHAMLWTREHQPPSTGKPVSRPSRPPVDRTFLLILAIAPTAIVALALMSGQSLRAPKRYLGAFLRRRTLAPSFTTDVRRK
jgi:hypothetical protein